IFEAVDELKEKGIKLIDEAPRVGAHGMTIAFMHPKATLGILMELCQPTEDAH
ncbi:MAG: methylmalonyl-CoA epimerase, partial [Deltaproteobacteria bacterium]